MPENEAIALYEVDVEELFTREGAVHLDSSLGVGTVATEGDKAAERQP